MLTGFPSTLWNYTKSAPHSASASPSPPAHLAVVRLLSFAHPSYPSHSSYTSHHRGCGGVLRSLSVPLRRVLAAVPPVQCRQACLYPPSANARAAKQALCGVRCFPSVPLLDGNVEVILRPLRLDARFFKSRQQIPCNLSRVCAYTDVSVRRIGTSRVAPLGRLKIWYNIRWVIMQLKGERIDRSTNILRAKRAPKEDAGALSFGLV